LSPGRVADVPYLNNDRASVLVKSVNRSVAPVWQRDF